jgi:hypothetical protein
MEFEGLVVLALDLEFGLQLLDEEFEARNFGLEFLDVGGASLRAIGSRDIEIVCWCVRRRSRMLLAV